MLYIDFYVSNRKYIYIYTRVKIIPNKLFYMNSMLNSHLCMYESVNVLLVMTVHDSGDWYGYLMSTQTTADSL